MEYIIYSGTYGNVKNSVDNKASPVMDSMYHDRALSYMPIEIIRISWYNYSRKYSYRRGQL